MERHEGDRGMEHQKWKEPSCADQKEKEAQKEKKKRKEETRQRKCYTYDFLGSCLDPYDYKLFSSVKGMISGFFVYGSTLGIGVIEIIRFFDEDQEGEKGKQQPLARAACVLCALAAVAITFSIRFQTFTIMAVP